MYFDRPLREKAPRGRKGALTGTGRGFPSKLLQKGTLSIRRRICKAFRGLLLLDLIHLLSNRESLFDTWKRGQEERRPLQWLRRFFWFVPLLQTSGSMNAFESKSLRGAGE